MPTCHRSGPARSTARGFATAPYQIRGDGEAPAPTVLPGGCDEVRVGCRLRVHHARPRKTGPGHEIVVLECRTHRRAFTLYPLGHVPYGRAAWAPVTGDGAPLWSADEPMSGRAKRALAWRSTIFRAAFDAAAGTAWPREGASPCGVWASQLCRLDEAMRCLGLLPIASPRAREQLAGALGVPQLVLEDTARLAERASGYRACGEVVVSLLERLAGDRIWERLMICAVTTGCWRVVARWDPGLGGSGRPHRRVFRGSGMASSAPM